MRCADQQRQLGVGNRVVIFSSAARAEIRVLHQFELPVGEMVHRGGKLFGRRPGTVTEMVQLISAPGKSCRFQPECRPAISRPQNHSGKRASCLRISTTVFQKFALHPQGTRDGIVRFRHRRSSLPSYRPSRVCTAIPRYCGVHMTVMATPELS